MLLTIEVYQLLIILLSLFAEKVVGVNHKLVILDEADSITNKAQNLLNTVIAEYIHNTRFVFICNECHKITEPIQSRCNIIRF